VSHRHALPGRPSGDYFTGSTLLIDGGCSLFQFSQE
jgi:hypothetical protein